MEGLVVSDMASIICTDTGCSVILMGAAWESYPVERSWRPGSRKYSLQDSLGRGIHEDSLRCHYFAKVKFSCIEISECSSTRFFQFPGTVPFLI